VCAAEWEYILKTGISNSVEEIILLPQDSSCHIEVNVNIANDFSMYGIELLGLGSARPQALLYSAESAGFHVEARES